MAVSLQPLDVHMNPYVPATVKPLIDVVGDVGATNAVIAGLLTIAVHVPIPVAAIVAVEY